MKAEIPAKGILKQGNFGNAMFFYVQCDCGNDDCSHTIEVEADDMHVQVHLYSNHHTKWWQKNRWKQIWQILTQGYAEMQTTLVLDEQTALNYAKVLEAAMVEVKNLKSK